MNIPPCSPKGYRRALALAFLLTGCASLHAATYNVKNAPYNAQGNGTTDDWAAINSAIQDAKNAGSGNIVYIPAGTYRINNNVSWYIAGANNLTVQGDPGTLIVTETNADVFNVNTSSNVAINMIKIDVKPLRFTQGTVNSQINARKFRITLDSGYPALNTFPLNQARQICFYTDPSSIAFDRYINGDSAYTGATFVSGSQWDVTTNVDIPAVVVGKRVVIWDSFRAAAWGASVNDNTGPIAITDFEFYGGGGGAGVGMHRNSGPVTLTRVKVGVPAGSTRMISASGAFDAQGNSGTITLDGCDVSRTQEDTLDCGGDLAHIRAHPASNQIRVENTQNYAVGNTVQIWDWTYQNQRVRDTATITAASLNTGTNEWTLTLDHGVTIVNTGTGPGNDQWAAQEQDGIDRCINLNAVGAVNIRNCSLQTSGRHFNFKAPNSTIENNYFYDTPWCIFAAAETFWHGGPAAYNLTIRNNVFDNMGITPIEVEVRYSNARNSAKNIVIEGNTFIDCGNIAPYADGIYGPRIDIRGAGIRLVNTQTATIRHNRFIGNWGPAIVLDASSDIRIENNRISGSHYHTWSNFSNYGVDMSKVVTINNCDNVTLVGNLVSDLGPYSTTPYGVSSSSTNIFGLSSDLTLDTGAGGSPALLTWYKADTITGYANGNSLISWTDFSANGNYSYQNTAGNQPTYATNAMNGKPVVRFNAANSQHLWLDRPVADDFTMFLVFKSTQGTSTSLDFYAGASLLSGELGGVTNDFGTSLNANGRIIAGTGNPDTSLNSGTGFNDGLAHVVAFKRVKSSGALTLYVDGTQKSTATGGTQSLNSAVDLALGIHPTGANPFSGDISEVKIFRGALADTARQAEENQLRAKWAPVVTAPWSTQDVGTIGIVGGACQANSLFTLVASGGDIYNTSDEFRLVSQAASGDCEIIARVDSLENSDANAKAGVMIRETTAANSRVALVQMNPGKGVQFIWRGTAGGSSSSSSYVGDSVNVKWVRLVRSANNFTAYYKVNAGDPWTQVGTTQSIAMAASTRLGLAACSHNNSALTTAVFSGVTATP